MSRIITERHTSALPEVGKISVGEKRTNNKGNEFPTSLDFFKATGKYAEMFHQVLGEKPSRIKVVFASDDIDQVCNERYECWERVMDGKTMRGVKFGSGDGQTFEIWDDVSKVYVRQSAEAVRGLVGWKWQVILTLRVICVDVKGVIGTWKFSTRAAKSTIPSIVSTFDWVKTKAGTIVGLPFDLVVEKHSSKTPGEVRNYPVVSLVPNFTEESVAAVQNFIHSGGDPQRMGILMVNESKLLPKEGEES